MLSLTEKDDETPSDSESDNELDCQHMITTEPISELKHITLFPNTYYRINPTNYMLESSKPQSDSWAPVLLNFRKRKIITFNTNALREAIDKTGATTKGIVTMESEHVELDCLSSLVNNLNNLHRIWDAVRGFRGLGWPEVGTTITGTGGESDSISADVQVS